MSFKPFRPPTFTNSNARPSESSSFASTNPNKRRKLSPQTDPDDISLHPADVDSTSVARKPLKPLTNISRSASSPSQDHDLKSYFSIVWRKVTAKKNKTWEDDGVLAYKDGSVVAYNSKGHRLGTLVLERPPELEAMLSMNGKDLQVEAGITYDDYARVLGKDNTSSRGKVEGKASSINLHDTPVPKAPVPKLSLQDQMRQQIQKNQPVRSKHTSEKSKSVPLPRPAPFKNPLKNSHILAQVPSETPIPRHDPGIAGALVFARPKKAPKGRQIVDVVLDPLLTKQLRTHQRDGIKFLYECVMGLKESTGQGCILADDMGLGKTLQTIALIWTLLKQNPIYKEAPVIKKVLIVCPVTLVSNWMKEFRKWLGRDRVGVMSFDEKRTRLSNFDGRNFQVVIVGYERLLKIAEDLNRGSAIDLIVCDEGHRLKTQQNKSAKAIDMFNATRRIILSGTPIQNDLSEFFTMVNFVNDGILGSYKAFLRDFEKPILKSRQPNASQDDIEKGQAASEELAQTTSQFILRRTADILSNYLPPKTEYVLFCRPTREQANLYRQVLQTPMFKSAMGGGSTEGALQLITILKKLCNSPSLLQPKQGADEATSSGSLQTLTEMMPKGLSRLMHNMYSSKIRLLDELLQHIKTTTDDKIVLVSNYTATLDLMQNVVSMSGMNFKRLDGSVTASKRQSLVDEFNRTSPSACRAFLLSAKAGGMGINLIGANRLILFDVDWNPAVEDQAMARIHRQGQKKPCYIYRFLIKGALEERIWQRQVVKRALADSIMEGGPVPGDNAGSKRSKNKSAFSAEELRDLFSLDESEGLRTHDLIGCTCQNKPSIESIEQPVLDIDELGSDTNDDDLSLQTFSFTRASQISGDDLLEQEESIRSGSSPKRSNKKRKRGKEEELQELMTYTHIDTSECSLPDEAIREQLEGSIDDPCLMSVLKMGREELPGNIAYVFLKRSKDGSVEDGNELDEHSMTS